MCCRTGSDFTPRHPFEGRAAASFGEAGAPYATARSASMAEPACGSGTRPAWEFGSRKT